MKYKNIQFKFKKYIYQWLYKKKLKKNFAIVGIPNVWNCIVNVSQHVYNVEKIAIVLTVITKTTQNYTNTTKTTTIHKEKSSPMI